MDEPVMEMATVRSEKGSGGLVKEWWTVWVKRGGRRVVVGAVVGCPAVVGRRGPRVFLFYFRLSLSLETYDSTDVINKRLKSHLL